MSKKMVKLQHRLTAKHVRCLAYQLAIAHNKKFSILGTIKTGWQDMVHGVYKT